MQWYDLPEDVLLTLYDGLDVRDLRNLEMTSRKGYDAVSARGLELLLFGPCARQAERVAFSHLV